MKLSLDQVRYVSGLARLSLSAEEEERYREQLSAILDAVEALRELDTEGVEPTSWATFGEGLLRDDVVQASLGAERAVANAPEASETRFAVPKVIE
ncbi:MAG: Asp-tRNA(Asn)/Glu-tRNA(Gln) amidotransferase subunit GatC [Myxococcaceae bacterium]